MSVSIKTIHPITKVIERACRAWADATTAGAQARQIARDLFDAGMVLDAELSHGLVMKIDSERRIDIPSPMTSKPDGDMADLVRALNANEISHLPLQNPAMPDETGDYLKMGVLPPAPRCEPPPEHREKRWHWIKRPNSEGPIPLVWVNATTGWICVGEAISPDRACDRGWRYVAPCEEPKASPRPVPGSPRGGPLSPGDDYGIVTDRIL